MNVKIALLAGDGIGPEVIDQAVKVSDAIAKKFGHQITWKPALTGAAAIDAVGEPYPDETHEICVASDAVLFGAIGHPRYDNDPSAKVRPEQGLLKMRKKLGLFANVRPTFTFPSLIEKSPLKRERIEGTDLVFLRELTGRFVEVFSSFATGDGDSESDLLSGSSSDKSWTDVSLGVSVGKKWINKKGWTFEIYIGAGKYLFSEDSPSHVLRYGLTLGKRI